MFGGKQSNTLAETPQNLKDMVKQYSKIAIFELNETIKAQHYLPSIKTDFKLKTLTFEPKYAIVITQINNGSTSDVESYYFDDDNFHSIWYSNYDNYLKCKRIINGNEIHLEADACRKYTGYFEIKIIRIIAIG